MKQLRRLLPLVLILALCLSLSGNAGAYAYNAEFYSTRCFINELKSTDLSYKYRGKTDGIKEEVVIYYHGDNDKDFSLSAFFGPDENDFYLRCWNLIDFSPSDYHTILDKTNKLNDTFNFAAFVVNTADYSVYIKLDSMLTEDCGKFCLEYVYVVGFLADAAYQMLAPYAIQIDR